MGRSNAIRRKSAYRAGIEVRDQVGSVSAAKRAANAGVDFIIAQGEEAGGHIAGTVSTMVLTRRVVETVAPIPVATAGGIADGRGLAAVLALGAEADVLHLRFLSLPGVWSNEAAVVEYQRAIALNPEDERYYEYLAESLRALGRTEEAERALREAERLRAKRKAAGTS